MPSARQPAGMRPWSGRYARQWTAATLARWGTVCHLCRTDGADSADHLIPRSKGGPDSLDNLRPAHHGCNSARGDLSLAEWFALHPIPRREALAPSREW
jgi:5-methylcytosine-specific restriction endonuclease McrA